MSYGMQISASGVLSSLYQMDVYSNNLANLTTAGFKADMPVTIQRDAATVEDHLTLPSNKLLERLGAGVTLAPNRTSFEEGQLQNTGNPLDVAIQGDGFFVMLDERADPKERLRLSRDGRFSRNDDGVIVSATTGQPVLDASNRPIQLSDQSPIEIEPNGNIRQKGAVVAKLQVVSVPDKSQLAKAGHGMFRASAEAMNSLTPAKGALRQGMVEGSSVDPIRAMLGISEAGRAAEANFSMISSADRLTERAINGLGRVA